MLNDMTESFSIAHLKVVNYKGVRCFDCDFSEGTNAIVGANGAGKSTILCAINVLFSWFVARVRNSKGNGDTIKDEDITKGESECLLEVSLSNGVWWKLYKQRSSSRKKPTDKTNLTEMMAFINDVLIANEKDCDKAFLPLFASYGVNRVVEETPGRLFRDKALNPIDVYDDKLNRQLNYRSFFRWFNERESVEDKEFRYNHDGFEPDVQLQAVRDAIEGVMPEYSKFHVKNSPHTFVLEKDGKEFNFDQLSDGEKALIAMVGDVARKLAMTHPNAEGAPIHSPGIILIDELDLHLHPSWQRDVLPRLKNTFTGCQFVITTHSPFILSNISSAKDDKLFLMSEGEERIYSSNIFGSEVGKILNEVLEMPSLRNSETDRNISVLWNCLKDGDSSSEAYRRSYDWLKAHLNPSDIVFVEIAMQQKINALKRERNA